MNFEFTEEQKMIANAARDIAKDFPPEYWREKEEKGEFAEEFFKAVADAGFFGIVIPEEYGGAGYGMQELLVAMEELCANGCGAGGARDHSTQPADPQMSRRVGCDRATLNVAPPRPADIERGLPRRATIDASIQCTRP